MSEQVTVAWNIDSSKRNFINKRETEPERERKKYSSLDNEYIKTISF